MLHCQNCGKAGLAVFQASTPGRPTLMATVRRNFSVSAVGLGKAFSAQRKAFSSHGWQYDLMFRRSDLMSNVS